MANMNKNVSDYSLTDLLNLQKRDIFYSLNCHAIGKIQAFNPLNQTATVTINYKKTFYTRSDDPTIPEVLIKEYPILADVPVICLGGGSSHLTFPINTGDDCLLFFNDRDLDTWWASGQNSPPATNRLHSFSDAIALVGLNSLASLITNYSVTHATLRNGIAGVGVSAAKVKVFNATDTLNGLLQELITEVKALVTQTALITVVTAGVTSTPPVNSAAITAVSTNITATALKIAGLLE